ncbi:hypothetical protein B9Z55_000144 [Caenorhabditis nigoni]|nr:hypothetical protein B9Z55_000144 [Caenorhabditis nigoni]
MSPNIPDAERKLSYDCLKCVIQNFEVNFRFQLAGRLPEISFAEKAVPLFISKLLVSEEGFELNDTKYQFGVIRQARGGPNPIIIEDENRSGGTGSDFDRFGYDDYSLPELTPGDILIHNYDSHMEFIEDFEFVEARLVKSKETLTALERDKIELECASEELENMSENPVELEPEQLDRRRRNMVVSREERLQKIKADIRVAQIDVEYDEYDLQCYRCKRDNLPSPYDMSIQLTKTSPDGTTYIERFNYNKRLMEAKKYLICKFLGNRQLVTKIKSLNFWAHRLAGLVFGLPEGIKLDVEEFATSGNLSEVLQRVETILEYPNRPFARLQSDGLKLEDAHHPKVRNAGVLVLYNNFNVDFVALCREVPNKNIVITGGRELQPVGYAAIVENLINTKGTLGTCYEITISNEDITIDAIRVIKDRFENAVENEMGLKDILVLVKPVDFALKAVTSTFNAKSTGFTSTKMSFNLIFSKFTAVSQKQKTYSEPEFYGLSNDIGHEVFQLVERLPKLSLAEKAVPLYISNLSICTGGFQLNDTKYRLGVIRQAREGPNPMLIEEENQKGGTEKDIDRFGFEKRSLPELTPGDIFIQDVRPHPGLDCNLKRAEARVVAFKNSLAALERQKIEVECASEEEIRNVHDYPREVDQEEDEELLEDAEQIRKELLVEITGLIGLRKIYLENVELDLQRYQCKRDNVPAPYDMFIQLTKTSPDGAVYIERFNYDKTLHEARKYLITKFLGNRRVVTKIKSLGFWTVGSNGLVVGLPEGVKFDVQEFGTSGNLAEVLQRVETILEHPSRPFARLELDGLRLEDVQNLKVREAGVLVFVNNWKVDVIALCRAAPNKKIVIQKLMQPGDYALIVENLIDTKGTLGTCYEFTELNEDRMIDAMNVIHERFEYSVARERLVTIPLPNQLQLDVSYDVSYENSQFALLIKYKIKMEVVQSQNN